MITRNQLKTLKCKEQTSFETVECDDIESIYQIFEVCITSTLFFPKFPLHFKKLVLVWPFSLHCTFL